MNLAICGEFIIRMQELSCSAIGHLDICHLPTDTHDDATICINAITEDSCHQHLSGEHKRRLFTSLIQIVNYTLTESQVHELF